MESKKMTIKNIESTN